MPSVVNASPASAPDAALPRRQRKAPDILNIPKPDAPASTKRAFFISDKAEAHRTLICETRPSRSAEPTCQRSTGGLANVFARQTASISREARPARPALRQEAARSDRRAVGRDVRLHDVPVSRVELSR